MIKAEFKEQQDEITARGLTQWDSGQELEIVMPGMPAQFQVHFAHHISAKETFVIEATGENDVAIVPIPNILLHTATNAIAWIYINDGEVGETIKTIHLPIETRPKPANYAYTETQIFDIKKKFEDTMRYLDVEMAKAIDRCAAEMDAMVDALKAADAKNATALDNFKSSQAAKMAALEEADEATNSAFNAFCGKYANDLATLAANAKAQADVIDELAKAFDNMAKELEASDKANADNLATFKQDCESELAKLAKGKPIYMHQVYFSAIYDGMDDAHPSCDLYFSYYSPDETTIEKSIAGLHDFVLNKCGDTLICFGAVGNGDPIHMLECSTDAVYLHPGSLEMPINAEYYCENSWEKVKQI